MKAEELVAKAKAMIEYIGSQRPGESAPAILAETKEFLRTYAGEKSIFFLQLADGVWPSNQPHYVLDSAKMYLEAFVRYAENDLLGGTSVRQQARLDVVSDFLSQADTLLSSEDIHPAAPTVIIGAALEEFLRNWCEEAALVVAEDKKPSLDSYAKALRKEDLLTKQDMKDITSWSGLRNHAAHGEWDQVGDRNRISVMLEGVNLFMRRYGKGSSP